MNISDNERLKAAYALNLWTVSIKQIIDYNDINIMQNEYDSIMNNLNLEKMPKDEALLDVIKEIMDCIHFFLMENGDKKFIELEYQHKMKNAIVAKTKLCINVETIIYLFYFILKKDHLRSCIILRKLYLF